MSAAMKAPRFASIGLFAFAGFVMVSALTAETGCSSTLAQPFEQMKGQPITIHRLQNFEPPAATAAQPATNGVIPGLPAQLQQWATAAQQMLPAGLIPPGLLPGSTVTPATPDAPRFYNFRILGSVSVSDSKMRDDIDELFGKESNFEAPKQSCMYAEFGFSIGNAGAATVQGAPAAAGTPADVLVSLSCNQVELKTYAWPYGSKTGLTADTAKKIVAIVQKAFGG